MQAYSDPKRENDPHALPNVEVFYRDTNEICESGYRGRCDNCGIRETPLADGIGAEIDLCVPCALADAQNCN